MTHVGVRVDYSAAIATAPTASSPELERPPKAIDNDVNTKFLDFNKAGWLYIDFGHTTLVNQYTIATANDFPERDPVSWVFAGSNDNTFQTYTILDSRTNYPTTDNRFTYLPYFPVKVGATDARVVIVMVMMSMGSFLSYK